MSIEDFRNHLQRGGCVAIPTETVYGLAAQYNSAEGIASIFRLKERPSFDPLIVHVASLEQVRLLTADWNKTAALMAENFWPGPLTLVLKKLPSVNPMITSGLETVGIRMPRHSLALELLASVGPLAAPSANRFGRTSPTSIEHVREEFAGAVATGEILLLDGGPCEVGVESTVCLVNENEVILLRPGGITIEQLNALFLSSPGHENTIVRAAVNHHASPGHLEHHYETKKPLILSWSEPREMEKSYDVEGKSIHASRIMQIELPRDPTLAARVLYSALREADRDPTSDALFIHRDVMQRGLSGGLWLAIDDRLSRAARLQIGFRPGVHA